MVQDRRTVSIKVEPEVKCTLSNGDVSDDLPWVTPNLPKHPNFLHFRRLSYLHSELTKRLHILCTG